MNKYDDIIKMTYPQNKSHNMSFNQRCFQFAPFAALNGFDEEVDDLEDIYSVGEYRKILEEVLNSKLIYLHNNIKSKPLITVTYFKEKMIRPYVYSGNLIKIDEVNQELVFKGNKIKFDDILEITSKIFNEEM